MPNAPNSTSKSTLRLLLGLAALDGAAAVLWLLHIPTENGLSAARLALLGLLLAGTFLPLGGLFRAAEKALLPRWSAWQRDTPANRRRVFGLLVAAFGGLYLLSLPSDLPEDVARAILTRIAPLVFYFVALALESALLLWWFHWPASLSRAKRNPVVRGSAILWAAFLLLWGFVALTGWGLTPEGDQWYAMGTPILETHLLLAWGLALAGYYLWGNAPQPKADAGIALAIYLTAALLWHSTPVLPNWFVTRPYPPNHQPYPASDALRYDTTAQSALIGEGLKTDATPHTLRPLYTGILAVLHALGGPGYQDAVNLQPFVLAVFPVLLYFLGLQVQGRGGGLLLALLLTFREQTAIRLSYRITVSHAKLLMADPFAALAMGAFILLAMRWLQAPRPRWQMALYSGAALGAAMLIRVESLVAGLVAGGLVFLSRRSRKFRRGWITHLGVFALGTALITAPWIGRNWVRYGTPFFVSPDSRLVQVFRRALESWETPTPAPGAVPGSKPSPLLVPPEGAAPSIEAAPRGQAVTPRLWLLSTFNYYLNSEIQSVLALPTAFRLPDALLNFIGSRDAPRFWRECCSAVGYLERMPYWKAWGVLPRQAVLPLLGNLLMIAAGITLAFRRLGWSGLLPLGIHSVYLLVNALFRISGGRYILPVNWIVLLYYAAGLSALTLEVLRLLKWARKPTRPQGAALPKEGGHHPKGVPSLRRAGALFPLSVVLLLGMMLPLGERAIPRRYSPETCAVMEAALRQRLPPEEAPLLEGLTTLEGRALYPRFLAAGRGEPDEHPLVTVLPYNRLTFYLIGAHNLNVRLPVAAVAAFPHAADVVVAGCMKMEDNKELLDARLVALVDTSGKVQAILWRSREAPPGCP